MTKRVTRKSILNELRGQMLQRDLAASKVAYAKAFEFYSKLLKDHSHPFYGSTAIRAGMSQSLLEDVVNGSLFARARARAFLRAVEIHSAEVQASREETMRKEGYVEIGANLTGTTTIQPTANATTEKP